ncbi:hypothetical protein T439DRAFT_328047 [Meredithblackwellia eburnea MCA 4105]
MPDSKKSTQSPPKDVETSTTSILLETDVQTRTDSPVEELSSSLKRTSISFDDGDRDRRGSTSSDRELKETPTMSSVSSKSSISSSLSSITSSISHSVLPHKHSKHPHSRKSHHHRRLPTPSDPVALAQLALQTLLTHPGPPIEELKEDLLPQLYHSAYQHRVNTREVGLDNLTDFVVMFRSRFRTVRVRFKSQLMDSDGTATMERSAVALTYDIVAVPISAHKHDAEERRVSCVGVVKIFDGKLAQSDIVVDTAPFHLTSAQELSCNIM